MLPGPDVGRVRRDHVDEADDVRPVEQGGRSARDLDPLGAVRVDRDAVVIRGAREVAGRDPVLDDVHPVPAEAADDRPARPRSEAAAGDARLILERLPDAARRLPGNLEASTVETALNARSVASAPAVASAVTVTSSRIGAGRHARELEPPVVGEGERARPENQKSRRRRPTRRFPPGSRCRAGCRSPAPRPVRKLGRRRPQRRGRRVGRCCAGRVVYASCVDTTTRDCRGRWQGERSREPAEFGPAGNVFCARPHLVDPAGVPPRSAAAAEARAAGSSRKSSPVASTRT